MNSAEKNLEKAYKTAISRLDGVDSDNLKSSQKLWWAFREKECSTFTGSENFGTDIPFEISICKANKANARAKELGELY